MNTTSFYRGMAGAMLAATVGCASASVPQERLVASQSAIRAAEQIGAEKVPAAALHLKLAREQTERGDALIQKKEHVRANYVLQRAEADAQLAMALAQEAPLRAKAQEAIDKVEALRQSND